MFVNDLFKITENSNEEYYAVYNQRGRPLIMRKPVGKTAEAYAEEKNYRIKGGPFDSHQATESFWIRSVLLGKDKKVDEDTFDDKSPHTSYVQSIRTLTNKDGDENYKHRVASVSTDKSGNQRVRALDTSRDFGDELTIDTIVPKNAKIDIVPQQPVQEDDVPDEDTLQQQGSERGRFPHYYEIRDGGTAFELDLNNGEPYIVEPGHPEWDTLYKQYFDLPTPNDYEPGRGWHIGKNPLAEAGPFSYGAKKPRKGSVADLAAQKRKEQEKGKQPAEPQDQRVGVARVTKDVAEAGNKPVEKSYFGMGDTRTPRELKKQMHSANDKFVQAASEPTGPIHSRVAKMQNKLAKSELRKRSDHNRLATGTNESVAEGSLEEFAPSGGGGGRWYSDDQLYDIIGEDWLEAFDVSGDQGNIDLNGERARLFLAQEAESWLTDRGYRVNVLDVRDDGDELSWYIQGPLYRGLDEDWKKVNRRDRTPGMSRKAVKAYRRENPGSKLQTAVTTKPSKLKKGSKSAKRRKSFCARMKGMKRAHAGAKTKRDPDSPINKALRRWNCESIEEMRDLIMIAEQRISAMREGGFDIPEIPRAPQPRPEPKNKTVEDKKLSDQEKQSLRQTVKDIDYTKPPTDTKARLSPEEKKELRQTVKDYEYPKPTNEASAREKLDRRFQELRKKRGAPDPEYYKELGKSYDIENDQERYARQAEIKKKYQVKEARKAEANFDVEDLKRLEQIRDLPTLKAQAMALISKPSERPMKPEKVAWFDAALDRMDSRMAIIKLMYDLLLSGEGHQVIGSKRSMNPNSYRSRFGESNDGSVKYEITLADGKKDYQTTKPAKAGEKAPVDSRGAAEFYRALHPMRKVKSVKVIDKPQEEKSKITNEDVERYVEELERAGYEIVNERRMTCPECGGAAYADKMLAEKQDACYHKVKSRYKVWPSAYASGALVRCRKKGAKNWGNKSKK